MGIEVKQSILVHSEASPRCIKSACRIPKSFRSPQHEHLATHAHITSTRMTTISGTSAPTGYSSTSFLNDPYIYQVGFGNQFASEALPGVLPIGQNSPQKNKYDLYTEGINGTSFTAPRALNQRTWFYRIRPSVSHDGFSGNSTQVPDLVSDFTSANPKVHPYPTQTAWDTFPLPKDDGKIDFMHGLKTIGGLGSATARDGLAFHLYLANRSMENTAVVNSDGDFLFIPEVGKLDIQTELGRLMVHPGEIAVVQCGLKFKIGLPDGPSRGYVQEIYGTHFELPELGPLGANGMANVRDFEHPVASFDIDQSNQWEIIYKIAGQFFTCKQGHTPFDVVAWHGNYVPYKYNLEKFITVGSITKDHTDPSIFCVLTVKSKTPGICLADFCVLAPRWDVVTKSMRLPYFHRNIATEVVGTLKGKQPGWDALNLHTGFCPHGPSADAWKEYTVKDLVSEMIYEGALLFLLETTTPMLLTEFALKCKEFSDRDVRLWKNLGPNFLNHIDEANAELKALGRPLLGQT
ncbi:homogentisate dioxygenase family protein [Abortiporus biennis]